MRGTRSVIVHQNGTKIDEILSNKFTTGAVQFQEMTDLALARGTNMDELDRQDEVRGSFETL